jgi:hypothetical protein
MPTLPGALSTTTFVALRFCANTLKSKRPLPQPRHHRHLPPPIFSRFFRPSPPPPQVHPELALDGWSIYQLANKGRLDDLRLLWGRGYCLRDKYWLPEMHRKAPLDVCIWMYENIAAPTHVQMRDAIQHDRMDVFHHLSQHFKWNPEDYVLYAKPAQVSVHA